MVSFAAEPRERLPKPDYRPRSSDPAWLAQVVQFHGHLGPSVVAGARIGMAGLRAVEAQGYFDVEVTCEGPLARPPQSCFIDGLQIGTGATMGKRSLHWRDAERLVVRVKNTRTGKTAELRPTAALGGLLGSFDGQPKTVGRQPGQKAEAEHLEAAARKIAAMPENEIVIVTFIGEATPK